MSGLTLTGVTVEAEKKQIVGNASFDAPAGLVTGLIGPNGAGKSTLLRAVAGIMSHSGGISCGDATLRGMSSSERGRFIALVPQDTRMDFGFSVAEVVGFGRHVHIPRFARPSAADRRAVEQALERSGVARLRHRRVSALSGGERQLTQVAKALAQDTPVLLADEPVSALDIRHQLSILGLLRELAREGRSVVTVLHDLGQAARWCDQLVLLNQGSVVATGTPAEVLTAENLAQHYGVEAQITADPVDGRLTVIPLRLAARPGDEAAGPEHPPLNSSTC